MPLKTTFVVQTFVLKRKRLVPGAKEVVQTDYGALKKADFAARVPALDHGPDIEGGAPLSRRAILQRESMRGSADRGD